MVDGQALAAHIYQAAPHGRVISPAPSCPAARSAGIQAFDTVYSDANNEAGFLQEAAHIKQLGFDGKSLINPRQIDLLHNLYAPTQKEVDHARRVVEAAEAAAREGLGVVSLNGKMVDGPVIDRARLVLSRAELSGIREE